MANNPQRQKDTPESDDIGGWGEMSPGWLQRNFRNVILPIIILLVVLGGVYLYNSQAQKSTPSSQEQTLEDILKENQEQPLSTQEEEKKEGITKSDTSKEIADKNAPSARETTAPDLVDDVYKINAAPGDGITHLARRTLQKYLSEETPDITLSAEQKIYAEDFIQNRTGTRLLEIGEEITFSKDLVREAAEAAQKLTEAEIQNLSKYVPLVPSLQS